MGGHPPFFAGGDEPDTDLTVLRKIQRCDYTFHKGSWSHVTDLAKDFITTILNPDPLKRPTCEEALKLPWLSERENPKNKLYTQTNNQEKPNILTDEDFM